MLKNSELREIVELWIKIDNYSISGFATMNDPFHIAVHVIILSIVNIKIPISAALT